MIPLNALGSLSWVLCLTGHHTEVFWGNFCEDGFQVGGPESRRTTTKVFWEGVVDPLVVVEAKSPVLWVSAHHGDEGEEQQADGQNQFSNGEDEFGFTVEVDSEDVKNQVDDNLWDKRVCWVVVVSPEMDHGVDRCDFERNV